MNKECKSCGKEFNGREKQRFCSKSCATIYKNKLLKNADIKIICSCSKEFVVSYNERNRKFCSKQCYIDYYKGKSKQPFTEEHKKNISIAKKGIKTGSRLTPANIQFWILKGFSIDESQLKVYENQSNAAKVSNKNRKNKNFEEIYGREKTIKIKKIASDKLKQNYSLLTIQEKEMLKLKNSESVSAFWNNNIEYVNKLKEKFSIQRSEFNKTKQRDFLLGLNKEKKDEIKLKKQLTYDNHTEQEKLDITKKRVINSQKSIIKNTWGRKIIIENKQFIVNSSFEEKFILKCYELSILIKRGPLLKYIWDEKSRIYFVDFEIIKNNKKYLVELKGTHKWYYEELNNGKLYAKNDAAKAYIIKNNYEDFIFILNNVKLYEKILEEL